MSKPRRILMLAFSDCQMLDVTGPLQMFAGVNDELGREAYELVIAAPNRGPFKTSSGVSLVANLAIADLSPAKCRTSDTLIAVGGDPCGRSRPAPRNAARCEQTFRICQNERRFACQNGPMTMAQVIEKTGAGEGNRTLVISLEGLSLFVLRSEALETFSMTKTGIFDRKLTPQAMPAAE